MLYMFMAYHSPKFLCKPENIRPELNFFVHMFCELILIQILVGDLIYNYTFTGKAGSTGQATET